MCRWPTIYTILIIFFVIPLFLLYMSSCKLDSPAWLYQNCVMQYIIQCAPDDEREIRSKHVEQKQWNNKKITRIVHLVCHLHIATWYTVHHHHPAVCLTTGPKPLPKRFLHIVRSKASSFKWEYPLLSLRSSSSFLRLFPRLLVTSISPFIFPSITCFRRQFLRKMWPIQLAFRFRISRRIHTVYKIWLQCIHVIYTQTLTTPDDTSLGAFAKLRKKSH